jgi:transposase-like protein
MNSPTKTRRRFTAQQKQEAIALRLGEGLSCTVVAQRIGIPISSLAKCVRQARSGFYVWRQRQQNPGPRVQENAAITAAVHHASIRSSGPLASRWAATAVPDDALLSAHGHDQTRFRPCRNPGNRANGAAESLQQQEFSPAAPTAAGPMTPPTSAPQQAGDTCLSRVNQIDGWRHSG